MKSSWKTPPSGFNDHGPRVASVKSRDLSTEQKRRCWETIKEKCTHTRAQATRVHRWKSRAVSNPWLVPSKTELLACAVACTDFPEARRIEGKFPFVSSVRRWLMKSWITRDRWRDNEFHLSSCLPGFSLFQSEWIWLCNFHAVLQNLGQKGTF